MYREFEIAHKPSYPHSLTSASFIKNIQELPKLEGCVDKLVRTFIMNFFKQLRSKQPHKMPRHEKCSVINIELPISFAILI